MKNIRHVPLSDTIKAEEMALGLLSWCVCTRTGRKALKAEKPELRSKHYCYVPLIKLLTFWAQAANQNEFPWPRQLIERIMREFPLLEYSGFVAANVSLKNTLSLFRWQMKPALLWESLWLHKWYVGLRWCGTLSEATETDVTACSIRELEDSSHPACVKSWVEKRRLQMKHESYFKTKAIKSQPWDTTNGVFKDQYKLPLYYCILNHQWSRLITA